MSDINRIMSDSKKNKEDKKLKKLAGKEKPVEQKPVMEQMDVRMYRKEGEAMPAAHTINESVPKNAAPVEKPKSKKWSLFNKKESEKTADNIQNQHVTVQKQKGRAVHQQKHLKPQEKQMKVNIFKDVPKLLNDMEEYVNHNQKIVKKLNTIRNMTEEIDSYAGQKVNYNPDSPQDIQIHVNILRSMFGMVCEVMSNVKRDLMEARLMSFQEDSLPDRFSLKAQMYNDVANRLGDEIELLKYGNYNKETVFWAEIIDNAAKETVIDISGMKTGRTGSALSNVDIIGEGDNQRFFKEEEKVESDKAAFKNAIDTYKFSSDEMKHKFKEMITFEYFASLVRTKEPGTDFINHAIVEYKNKYKEFGDKEFMEAYITILDSSYKKANVRFNAQKMGIDLGEKLTGRNIATTKLAELMGMNEVLVRNEFVTIKSGDDTHKGYIMTKASGTDYTKIDSSINDKLSSYTGEFQRQMVMLQIFDNIIGQADRHLNNMFYKTEEKNGRKYFTGINGIDNDMCGGINKCPIGVVGNQVGCLTKNSKYLSFDCMDKDMYQHMKTLNADVLRANLKGLMSKRYIDAVIERFEVIMKAIEASKERVEKSGKGQFLYAKEEWGANTIEKLIDRKKYMDSSKCRNYLERFANHRYADGKFEYV